jgi:hypothetical protein
MKNLMSLLSALTLAAGFWFMPNVAKAQGANGECSGGLCGTPNQSGGGCGCGCGSILVAMTNRGDTYQFADDFDGDGIEDEFDNCAFAFNFEQLDQDGDLVGDACDSCAAAANALQENLDGDQFGDACDTDIDGDLVNDGSDNCPTFRNETQLDTDGDNAGNACDDDDDGDGTLDIDDLCRLCADGAVACSCDDDEDGDDVFGSNDNCPSVYNPSPNNGDIDADGLGDLCDADKDGDLILNHLDNCDGVANPSQLDIDHDGLGDNGMWPAGPGSCDPTECYEIGAAGGDGCLNPNSAFDVQLALVLERTGNGIEVGDAVTVAIFSNRLDVNHTWQAQFEQLPRGSSATFNNQEGSGTTLAGFPQVANCIRQEADGTCSELNQISFVPDAPGLYEVKVTVNLPGGDPRGYGTTTAVSLIQMEVTGSAGGCAAGAGTGLAAMALGLMAVTRRRRRA